MLWPTETNISLNSPTEAHYITRPALEGNLHRFKWPTLNVEMLFCFQNCTDLLQEKIALGIEKNF